MGSNMYLYYYTPVQYTNICGWILYTHTREHSSLSRCFCLVLRLTGRAPDMRPFRAVSVLVIPPQRDKMMASKIMSSLMMVGMMPSKKLSIKQRPSSHRRALPQDIQAAIGLEASSASVKNCQPRTVLPASAQGGIHTVEDQKRRRIYWSSTRYRRV